MGTHKNRLDKKVKNKEKGPRKGNSAPNTLYNETNGLKQFLY